MEYTFTNSLRNAIDVASAEAMKYGADAITPAHLFLGLMDASSGHISVMCKSLGIDRTAVRKAMNKRFGVYSARYDEVVGFSATSMEAIERACDIAQGDPLNTHHMMLSLLHQGTVRATELTASLNDAGYNTKEVFSNMQHMIKQNLDCYETPGPRNSPKSRQRQNGGAIGAAPKGWVGNSQLPPTLAKYGRDLTALAAAGKLDPITGRDMEIQRAVRTLLRRRKNNPIFVGKAGVGKTAIVEGLAQCIASGDVPQCLRNARIIELSISEVVSGTKYRGDFEERITNIVKEAASDNSIILFIDETHTLLDGAGMESSGMSAADVLKPALSRGSISMIGATTLEEYRKYIEKDPALARRFQKIMIEEPSVEQTISILANLRGRYESHHGITIEDEAIRAAAELSERYINDRQLPDKAVDVVDEAASNLQMQGKSQMSKTDIASVISEMTGIPVGNIDEDESKKLINLEGTLHERVIGQQDAVSAVSSAIRRNRAGLKEANRPVGSFLFLGPTGVGKTELSLALSEALYDQKKALIRLDMSEYMESVSVAKIVGAAPGYVGYDSSSTLAEKIARKPYAVVLFDEVEKAHPDVWNILLQILDTGTLTDSSGREVSFKNAVVIVTSNIGANHLVTPSRSLGFGTTTENDLPKDKVLGELKKTLRPELLNRFDEIIVFDKLTLDDTVEIARKMVMDVSKRAEKAGLTVTFTEDAIRALAETGHDPAYGARPLRRTIQKKVEDRLATLMLSSTVKAGDCVECGVKDGEVVLEAKVATPV